MNFKNKIIIKKHKFHRRIWLSSIITLFIFATSISAYFLVKNSQDIRKSADEPYENECTCIYNSDCSVVDMKPCEGQCNPSCNYPAICCQPITEDLCSQGDRYCVDDDTLAVCKPDKSGYTITSCAGGTSCDSSQNACIPDCVASGGAWSSTKPCCSGLVKTATPYGYYCYKQGDCTPGTTKCQQDGLSYFEYRCDSSGYYVKDKRCDFGCDGNSCKLSGCIPGEKRCTSDKTAIEVCSSDGSAWTKQFCGTNNFCDSTSKSCALSCQGTCYSNSSCSAIGRDPAEGTCKSSTSICCQTEPKTATCTGTCYANASSCTSLSKTPIAGSCLYDTSVCCKEPVTPTCTGTCYTNSSCGAIGREPADGECRYSTSVCCQSESSVTCSGTCYTNTSSCASINKTPASGNCQYSTSVCCSEPIIPTCTGTCWADTSSCGEIEMVAATGSCRYATSACCKEPTATTPVQVEGVNCSGNCYKKASSSSSCSDIGKEPATGMCAKSLFAEAFSDLICCQEVDGGVVSSEITRCKEDKSGIQTHVGSGWIDTASCAFGCSYLNGSARCLSLDLKGNGETCSSDRECKSGYCYDSSAMTIKDPDMITFSFSRCQPYSYEEHIAATQQANQIAGMIATTALSFIPGVGPVVQIISAAGQGVQAVFTCSELAEIKNDPQIDQATKDQFSRSCATAVISAGTGAVGGGASLVGTFATGLSAGTKLTLAGASMVDNVGNLVVSGMNVQNACELYGYDSYQCYMALGNAGVAVGSTIVSGYQFGQSYKNYTLQPQTGQNLSMDNIKSVIKQEIEVGETDVVLKRANEMVDDLIRQGVPEPEAIAMVSNSIVPEYAVTPEQKAMLNIADKARTPDQVVMCEYTLCRHNSVVSDAISQSRGYDTSRVSMTWVEGGGHHLTAVSNGAGGYTYIDPTNGHVYYSYQSLNDAVVNNGWTIDSFEYMDLSVFNINR